MNIQRSEQELQDFYAYDANVAIRLVAQDEGKTFNRLLNKPSGYDEWITRENTISVANWVQEKCSQGELDINEIGRKMIKRSLFRTMAVAPASSPSRVGNSLRRAVTIKKFNPITRPGTPYPKTDGTPWVAGAGGTLQLAQVGGRLPAIPVPNAGHHFDYTTVSSTPNGNFLNTENARLRRELDELKAREFAAIRASGANMEAVENTPDLSFNMMGLTVAGAPILGPIPEHANEENPNADATMN